MGRQEETLHSIAEAGLTGRPEHIALVNDGNHRAGNQVPVLVDFEGNNRLDVQCVAKAVLVGSQSEIKVVLERDAYQ